MTQGLIGIKIDQTQKFLENGRRIPVTEINVPENAVIQVKTDEKDKYSAVQLGIGTKKKPGKAYLGHAKKAGVENAPAKLKEVKGTDESLKIGDSISIEAVFKPGDLVKVTGQSKGKGFAGVVKRYKFRGGPKTHGQSDRHRAPGSIGQTTTPGRVYKGKRMAGRMGSDTVALSNLVVVDVDAENKKLFVAGLIPGHKNSIVLIEKTGEKKKFVPLLDLTEKEEEVVEATPEAVEEAPTETPKEEVKAEEAQKEPESQESKESAPQEEKATGEVKEESVEEPKVEEAQSEKAAASDAVEAKDKNETKSDLAEKEEVAENA